MFTDNLLNDRLNECVQTLVLKTLINRTMSFISIKNNTDCLSAGRKVLGRKIQRAMKCKKKLYLSLNQQLVFD